MKKIQSIILCIFLLTNINLASASLWIDVRVNSSGTFEYIIDEKSKESVTRWQFFKEILYPNIIVPDSYKYIKVNFTDVDKNTLEYKTLQKLIYLDLLNNDKPYKAKLSEDIDVSHASVLINNFLGLSLSYFNNFDESNLDKSLSEFDLKEIKKELSSIKSYSSQNEDEALKQEIFFDVYNTITENHVDANTLNHEEMIKEAIIWLTKWTEDKYTTYFPPAENKEFKEDINWSFQGIWAYINLQKPGYFYIEGVIVWWPADKAKLQAWDRVLKVWDKEIDEIHTAKEIVSWIKWPKWTKVKLQIQRWDETFSVEITRDVVDFYWIEGKVLESDTYYIRIPMFNVWVASDYKSELQKVSKIDWIDKIIIDLRWNPWGLLSEVSKMLSFSTPKWKPTVVVKWPKSNREILSSWEKIIDFADYEVIVLVDGNSASASEIMAWTMKDYVYWLKIVWEKSFWKWSVQTIKEYGDGSSLKYTIARWYTWRTEKSIDKKWIIPDVEVEFDAEKYKENGYDSQLQKALEE